MSQQFTIDPIRRDRNALEAELKAAGCIIKDKSIKCGFHDDKSPSGGVYLSPDGVWRYKCHGCLMCEDIIGIRALVTGREWKDQAKIDRMDASHEIKADPAPPPRVFPTVDDLLKSVNAYKHVEAHYLYTNPETRQPDAVVIRCKDGEGKKTFMQAKPVDGGFVMKAPEKPWPLYNRLRIQPAQTVIVCEGEKCVHAFHGAGYVATTSMCGAGKAAHADWTPLAGKTVYLWPDNDEKGIAHMREVAEILQKIEPRPLLHWIDPAHLKIPPKGDVVEYLQMGGAGTAADQQVEIECALNEANAFGPSASVRRLIDKTISGERAAIDWPWPGLGKLTNALLPGTITAICGDPAASKSFMLLQAARHWYAHSVKFVLQQLEADEDGSHLMRALVQESGELDLWDWKWIKANPEVARQIETDNRKFLDAFGSHLIVPTAEPPPLKDLTDWVRDQMKSGCRIVAIDPISAAGTGDQRWEEDRKFVLQSQKCARDFGSSLIIVTHPKLGNKTQGMDGLAGGAAYSRFTQTVLWVRAFEPQKEFDVWTPVGSQRMRVNRSVKIAKARLGRGTGKELAYTFSGPMLFAEQGLVMKDESPVEMPI